LDLARNEISDISFLKGVKFEKLKILNLSMNNISNYNILEQVNFKELKELYLFSRNIRSIRYIIFRKCKI
jgi:Leucine-rich repeat (LRR) protein